MSLSKVRVLQRFVHIDAIGRVKPQYAVHEVYGKWICIFEYLLNSTGTYRKHVGCK